MTKLYMIEPSGTIHEYDTIEQATDAHNENVQLHLLKRKPKDSCRLCYGRGIMGTKLMSPIPYIKIHNPEKYKSFFKIILCKCCS